MRLGGLSLCLLGLASCARPSLGDLDDGGDVPIPVENIERDSGPAQVRDSSMPVELEEDSSVELEDSGSVRESGVDSGCVDSDKDGVCNSADNCPVDANPDQADADGDDTGDACSVDCDSEELPLGGSFGGAASLARVLINDRPGTRASVKAGSEVTVQLDVTFSDCGLAFEAQQVFLGLESQAPKCQFAPCSSAVAFTLPLTFRVTAPQDAGLHYLLAGIVESFRCEANSTEAGSLARKVAALCVQ